MEVFRKEAVLRNFLIEEPSQLCKSKSGASTIRKLDRLPKRNLAISPSPFKRITIVLRTGQDRSVGALTERLGKSIGAAASEINTNAEPEEGSNIDVARMAGGGFSMCDSFINKADFEFQNLSRLGG